MGNENDAAIGFWVALAVPRFVHAAAWWGSNRSAPAAYSPEMLLPRSAHKVVHAALLSPSPIGSDVTVQIISSDANLLVQLPFGSQTQTFLTEVRKRCSPAGTRLCC